MGCCSAQWLLRECFRCKAKPGEWGGKGGGWQGLQEAGGALMPAPPEKVFGPPIRGGAGRGRGDWGPSRVRSQEAAATQGDPGWGNTSPRPGPRDPGATRPSILLMRGSRAAHCRADTCSLALKGRSASCLQELGGAAEAPGLQGTRWDVGWVPLARACSQPPPLCWLPG